MPSAIAIRMYCVNLLDIFLPPKFPEVLRLAASGSDATRFNGGRRPCGDPKRCLSAGSVRRGRQFNAPMRRRLTVKNSTSEPRIADFINTIGPEQKLQTKTVRTSDPEHQICFLRDGRRKAAFPVVSTGAQVRTSCSMPIRHCAPDHVPYRLS